MSERKSRRGLPHGLVRLRKTNVGQQYGGYTVTVPIAIGKVVGTDQVFKVELTEDGILLRPVEAASVEALPSWLKGEGA